MKPILNLFLVISIMAVISSCGSGKKAAEAEATSEPVEDAEVAYTVDAAASEVAWKGEVAGVYGHNGVINIAEGVVSAKGSTITGGSLVIDMTSIQPLDTASYTANGKVPQDLVDHLSTGDFFMTEEFPTATFVIKSHVGDKLIGDLTIRGNTKEEEATITSVEAAENGLSATADLVFNRQDYEVAWVHYMKDMILSDDITIGITISANAE